MQTKESIRVKMMLTDLPNGDVLTSIYVNERLILSDVCPTPYTVLQALSQHIKGFELEPLLIQEYLIYAPEIFDVV